MKLTNTEFLDRVMNYSPYGALVQAFVLQALTSFCNEVVSIPAEALDTGLVSGSAWKGIAEDILRQYKENYQ